MIRRKFWGKPAYDVALVENNLYDRAVIGAALGGEPDVTVRYSIGTGDRFSVLGPYQLGDLEWREGANRIGLLDLALTKSCEEALARSEVQEYLNSKEGLANLRALKHSVAVWKGVHLSAVDAMWLLAEVSEGKTSYREFSRRDWPDSLKGVLRPILNLKEEGEVGTGRGGTRSTCASSSLQNVISATEEGLFSKSWREQSLAMVHRLVDVPSLGRLLALVLSNHEKVCFFAVSHYLNALTRRAVARVIMAGLDGAAVSQHPESPRSFECLLVEKSDLRNLAERIRQGYEEWTRRLSFFRARLHPFSSLPLMEWAAGESLLELSEVVQPWFEDAVNPEAAEGKCVVIWDQSGMLTGGDYGWSQERWEQVFEGALGIEVSRIDLEHLDGLANHCLVNEGWIESFREGKEAASLVRSIARRHPGQGIFVVLAGSGEGMLGFKASMKESRERGELEERVWEYNVPRLGQRGMLFGRAPSRAKEILETTPVMEESDGAFVPTWRRDHGRSLQEKWQHVPGTKLGELRIMIQRRLRTQVDGNENPWDAIWRKLGMPFRMIAEEPRRDVKDIVQGR